MASKKYLNVCNIYIALWVINIVQSLYWNSSVLSLACSVPLMLMSLYSLFQIVQRYHVKNAMKALLVFFLIMCIYGIGLLITQDAAGQDPKSFLLMLFNSLGPVFAFFTFAMSGQLTKKTMKISVWIFLVIAILSYFAYEKKALDLLVNNRYEEITNNSTYFFVALFPFLFLFDKKIIQYALILCIMVFVISGMKRGAILTGLLLLLWFITRSFRNATGVQKCLVLLGTVAVVFVGIRYVEYLFSTSDYFQYRVNDTLEGHSSGRNKLYSVYWNHFLNNSNLIQTLFGEGAYHTENILGYKAHNDWLELLIDCGVFGVLMYFIYWCRFLKQWIASRRNPILYSIFGACLCFTFVRTFFSMSFSDMPFSLCMILGYAFAATANPEILSYGEDNHSR